jgi:hypothetical protein
MSRAAKPSSTQPASKSAKKPFLLTPPGISAVVVTVLVVVVIAVDMSAKSAQRATRHAVEAAYQQAKARGESLYKKDIPTYLRGSPKHEKLPKGDRYTWSGILSEYHMTLEVRGRGVIQKATWD